MKGQQCFEATFTENSNFTTYIECKFPYMCSHLISFNLFNLMFLEEKIEAQRRGHAKGAE